MTRRVSRVGLVRVPVPPYKGGEHGKHCCGTCCVPLCSRCWEHAPYLTADLAKPVQDFLVRDEPQRPVLVCKIDHAPAFAL